MLRATSTENKDPNNSELQQYQQSFSYISAIERPQTSRNPSGSHNPPTFSFDQLLTPSTNVHRQTNVNDQDGLITFSSTPNGSPSRKSLSGSQRKDIDISYEHDLSKRPWDVPELAEEWVENEDGGNLMAELDLTENKQFDSLRLDQNEKGAEQEQKISSILSTPNQSTDVTGFSAQNPPSSGHQYETAPQTPAHFPMKSSKQSLQQQLFQQRLLKADSEAEMQFGTVQVNSIGNVPQSYDANVWGKRRFKDIFSPLTLENLFQPPTAKKSDVSQHRQQQETDSAEELSHQQKSPLQQIVIPEDLKRSLNMSIGTNGSKDDWSPKLEYSDVEGSLIYNSSPDRQIEYSGIADITFDENDFDFGMNDGNQHSFDNSMPPESAAIIEEFQRRNEHDLRETEQVSLLIGSRLPVVENGHSQIQSVPDKVMSSSQFHDNLLSQNLESSASNRNRVHTPEDSHDNNELPFDEGADQQSQNDSMSDVRDASISLQLRASLDENIQHENDKEFSFDTKDGTDVEGFQLGQETTTSTFPPFNYDTFTRERISAIVNQMESGKTVAGSHSQRSFNSSINQSSSRPMVSSFDIPNDTKTEEQENSSGGISCNLDGGMSKSSTGLSIPNSVDDTSVSAFDHLRRGQNLLEEIRQNMSQSQQSDSASYNEQQDEELSIAVDNVEIGGLPDEGELNAVRSQMEELGHFLHEQPQSSNKNVDSRVSSHDRDRFFQHSSFSDSPEFSSPSHSATFEDQKFDQEIADDEVSGLSNQVRRIRIAVEASPNDMGKEYQRLPASTNVDEILSSRHRANVRSPHFNPIPKKAVLIQQPNNSSVVYPDNIDDLDCTPDESNFSNAPAPAYEECKPIGVYFAPTSTHNVSIKPVKDDDEYPSDIDFVESVSDAESMTSEVNHAAGDSRSNNQKSDNFKPVKKRMGQIRNLNIAHHKAKSNPNICGQPESLKPSERQTNMIRINPTDADNLPDKIGNMIFDKIRNCWVELNPVSEVSKLDGPSASGIILNPRTDEFSGISNISNPSSASGSSHIRAKQSRLREDAFANSMNTDSDAGTTGISDHVGSMVFDRVNKRWVEMNTKDHTKSVTMNGESDMMTGDGFLEEDTDPFEEIEEEAEKSFEDECESNQFRASAIESTCFDHTKEKSSDQPVKTSFGHATEKLEKPQPESMSQSPKSERKDKAIDETLMDDTINDFGIPLVQPGSIAQAADRISRQDFAAKTISDENWNHTRKESGMDGIFDIPTIQNPRSVPNFDYLDHGIQEDNMPTPKPKEKSIKFAALEANVQTPIHQGPTELTMTGFRRQVRQNLLVDTPKPSKVELAFQSLEDFAAGSSMNEEQATAETFSRLEDSFHQLNTFADELPQPVRLDEPIDLSQMQPEIINSAKSTKTVSTSPLTILSPTFSRTSLHFQSQPNPLKQSSISVSTNFTTPASTKAENEPEKQLLQILTNKGTLVELETATELDLRESGIESLQGLNELVGGGQLVKCNLDKNKLRYLTGVPNSVIHLSLRTNRLTTLTSFSHMTNLQYLNISNNVVDDLIGLSPLKHLRELHADNNGISSCGQLPSIDGLLRLSLKNNNIEDIDLNGVKLPSLEFFDLSYNIINEFNGASSLPTLKCLILDHNAIRNVAIDASHPTLQHLSLNNNNLTELTLSNLPNLRTIEADCNQLTSFSIASNMQLDEIHVCSQSLPSGDLLSLSKFPLQDCRRIYLSGNMIKTLEPYSQFHQAEVLEVAKAGIRHLPELMSKVMPCLKELDLSGNSIVDITPLRSLKKLRRLNVMGNDIGDFYEVAKTINGLRTLEILDIRQNPLTALFYTNYLPPTPNSLPGDSPPSSPLKSHNSWLEQDTTYLKTLNDTTYVKRHCYRTTLIYLLQKTITSLDHIPVTESERKGVTHAYNRMKRRLNRVFVRKVYKHVKVNQRGGRGATDEANLKPSRCEDPRPPAISEYVTPRPSTKDNVKQSRNDKVPSTSFAPVVSTGLYDDLTSQTQIMNEIIHILHSPPNALTKLDPALNSNTFQSGSMPPLTLGATPSQAHVEKQDKENYGMKHNEAASAEPMADTRNLSGVFVVQNGMGKELEGRTSSKAMRERQVSESSVNVGMKKAKE